MKNFTARQGDVYVEQISSLPKGLKKSKRDAGRIILAYGEVTGHAHAIVDEDVKSFVDDSGTLFLKVEEETEILHEEHDKIELPPGVYKITHQRQYHPQEIRRVAD